MARRKQPIVNVACQILRSSILRPEKAIRGYCADAQALLRYFQRNNVARNFKNKKFQSFKQSDQFDSVTEPLSRRGCHRQWLSSKVIGADETDRPETRDTQNHESEPKFWVNRLASTLSVRLDEESYAELFEVAATLSKKHTEREVFVEMLLEWMIEKSKNHSMIRPTTFSFAVVLNAWVHSGHKDAYKKVEKWLKQLEALHEEGWPNLQPNVVVYNILLKAMANAGQVDRATEVMRYMLKSDGSKCIRPDQTSFTTLLTAYAKSNEKDAMQQAELLLNEMESMEEDNHPNKIQYGESTGMVDNAKPNRFTYTAVINGWARQGNGDRAENLLYRLMRKYLETKDPGLRPDVIVFNNVLLAWVRSGNPLRADQLLRSMIHEAEWCIRPNLRSFNTVLASWARVGAPEEAEALLTSMHRKSKDGGFYVPPDIISYNTCLDAWSKASQHRQDACDRAEAILRHMEKLHKTNGENRLKPNVRTWNTVINSVAKAGKVNRAEDLLEEFIAASKSDRVDGIPNIRTWNTVIGACLKGGDAERAETILARLRSLSAAEGNKLKPDIITYNTVLQCHAISNNSRAGENADAVFQTLIQDPNVVANRVSYLARINAWVNCGVPEQAEQILLDLCRKDCTSSIVVTRGMFHKVLEAWSEHRAPKEAEALLFKMVDCYNSSSLDVKPTVETYNRVLHCWSQARTTEAGERAELILRQMEDLTREGDKDSTPDVVTYNSVLNAWANSGNPTAVKRAEHLVLEMILKGDPKVVPTHITYGTWLKTIESGTMGDKVRQAKEVLRTMKIHNFNPTPFISSKLDELCCGNANKEKR